ncbi:MAG: 50S ribosomal protein L6 [Candidatus Pacearchaeota archaeon]|nr:50S ribosomal protein L6 [Candidatus Pacearchaeota archaeon]
MRKLFSQEIEIPEGIEVKKEGKLVVVKGPQGEISKEFNFGKLKYENKEGKISISYPSSTRKEKRMINTISAHLRNMIKGAKDKFEYKLKICASHFPINVEIKGNEVSIKNFLGEKTPRKCRMPEGVEIQINKEIITIKSPNKELAGQAAATFETTTKVRNRDRRVFQDGIYIINKAGEDI